MWSEDASSESSTGVGFHSTVTAAAARLNNTSAMVDGWCYSCGGDHPAPRGKKCKEAPVEGHSKMPTRRTPAVDPKATPEEAAAAYKLDVETSLAEIRSADKFATHEEYQEYLEELDEEEKRHDDVEALEQRIRDRITARAELRAKKTKGIERQPPPPPPPPPRSRDPSPDPRPRTSTRIFDPREFEGRDSSAERLSKSRRKFDLKRFTRGREPRSLSYAELMYISLQWAAVGIDEGTFRELGEIKKFLKHLGYVSFKASSELYDTHVFAEYDADLREECVYGSDIDEFCFGNDSLTKLHFDNEGMKKKKNDSVQYQHPPSNRGNGRGGRGGAGRGQGGGGNYNRPPTTEMHGIRVDEGGKVMSCDRYNRGGCDTRNCTFAHVCGKCSDPTHKSTACTNVRMFTG